MAAHSNFATDPYDPGRSACVICGTRSGRSKVADLRPANPAGWGWNLAHTADGNGREISGLWVRRVLTYGASLAGLAVITIGEYPDWLQGLVVGMILVALGLAESRMGAR